jgi:hypothetical protein
VRVVTDDGDPRPLGTLAEVLTWQRIAAWAERHRELIAPLAYAPGPFEDLLGMIAASKNATRERIAHDTREQS